MDYIDKLSRLGLSRQQAAVLLELYRLGPEAIHPWGIKAGSRSESASMSRALHRLRDRGYVMLLARPPRRRFTHLQLTDNGRALARRVETDVL